MSTGFTERGRLKKRLNNRLKSDGCWDAYNALRALLKRKGVDESTAWIVAAYQFPPRSGAPPEIAEHPMFAEIAANWANGGYPTIDEAGEGEESGSCVSPPSLADPTQR